MGWLKDHLELFVVPVLRYQPAPTRYFTQEELTVIKNIWRSVKAKANGAPVLLPGRDVFIFEVLARREGYPTTFRPDISRLTVDHVVEDYSNHFVFDTGYSGSIPRGLRAKSFSLASGLQQIFPKLTRARSLVLKIEGTPKYWHRGFWRKDLGICQELTEPSTFALAAGLTQEIYKNQSPKFIPTRQPIAVGRWQSFDKWSEL